MTNKKREIPAHEAVYVSYSSKINHKGAILSVINMNASLVLTREIRNTTATELNVSDLSPGIYLLKLTTPGESRMKKLIISH